MFKGKESIIKRYQKGVIDVVLVFLWLNLNRFMITDQCSHVSMVDFEQENVCWVTVIAFRGKRSEESVKHLFRPPPCIFLPPKVINDVRATCARTENSHLTSDHVNSI